MEKTYGQYCGLARSLDHVGDRWTLLIIRELLVAPSRYRDLLDGLPGVATNLLAQRLRQLEADGLVQRRLADDGSAAVLYELTPLGANLESVILALVSWGTTWMLSGPGDDAFRPRWLVVALRSVLERTPSARPTRVSIVCGNQPVGLTRDSSGLTISLGDLADLHATLTGEPDAVLALATRTLTLEDLKRAGALHIDGSNAAVRRALFATTGRHDRDTGG